MTTTKAFQILREIDPNMELYYLSGYLGLDQLEAMFDPFHEAKTIRVSYQIDDKWKQGTLRSAAIQIDAQHRQRNASAHSPQRE